MKILSFYEIIKCFVKAESKAQYAKLGLLQKNEITLPRFF